MHPNKHFRVIDQIKLLAFVKKRGFGTLVAVHIQGTWKLSQNKQGADVAGAIAGLEGRGDAASVAVAALIKAMHS